MENTKPKKSSSKLLELIRLCIFETIFSSCACSSGDKPHLHTTKNECDCNRKDVSNSGARNRGKTGAGVTGSRGEISCNKDKARQGSGLASDEAAGESSELPTGAFNPGLLRHIHNAARYRIPQCFEGACVSVKQNVGSNWVLGHTMLFSSVAPGGYKMLMSYVEKNKQIGLPYMIIEAAPGGQMSSEIRVRPTQGTRATIVAQIADTEVYSFESTLDAYFKSWTASVIAVNREFIALHYLQRVTEHLSLGAEVVARGQTTELSSACGAARWFNNIHTVSATLGNRGLDLCYARVVQPFLTVAAMLEVGFAIRRSVATLAYEWNAQDWSVRASVDSDGLVGATLERALGGERALISCALSALLNHPNDKFRLGFGVSASII